MLAEIFEKLDHWIIDENRENHGQGNALIAKCEFKVVGQAALLEANLTLSIAATGDLDAFTTTTYQVIAKLNEFLKLVAMEYDQLSNEIWMPEETQHAAIYQGDMVTALRALPEYVIASKAKYAPEKNKDLIIQYLASEPRKIFFELCQKYKIDLESL